MELSDKQKKMASVFTAQWMEMEREWERLDNEIAAKIERINTYFPIKTLIKVVDEFYNGNLIPPDVTFDVGVLPKPNNKKVKLCELCGENNVRFRHHYSYFPEKTMMICKQCHGIIHHRIPKNLLQPSKDSAYLFYHTGQLFRFFNKMVGDK